MTDKRPFDMLNNIIGERVIVKLREGSDITGVLDSFDVHMNVVLDNAEESKGDKHNQLILRGDNIVFIAPISKE
jgi:small nuclear ribonucleoprotein